MRLPLNFLFGAMLIFFVVSAAIVSIFWTPHSHSEMNISMKFADSSSLHWLGTDQLGRDVVSQLMVAAQNSVQVALIAVFIGGAIGTFLGLIGRTLSYSMQGTQSMHRDLEKHYFFIF